MAYYIDYVSAGGKYFQVPSGNVDILIGQNFEVQFVVKRNNVTNTRILGRVSSSSSIRFPTTTTLQVQNAAASSVSFTVPANFTDFIHYRVWRDDGANVNLSIDGGAPQTLAQAGRFIFERILADATNVSASCQLKWIKLWREGTLLHHWENTTGTGTQLPDLVGSLTMNQIGTWPSNDSEWVFYEEAGSSLDVTLGTLGPTATAYAPLVTKDKLIDVPHIVSTGTVGDPTVTKDKLVELEHIQSTTTVTGVSVAKEKLITNGPLPSSAVVFQPTVVKEGSITLGPAFIQSTSSVHPLSILKDKAITLGHIGTTEVTYAPEIIGGAIPLPDVKLYTAEGWGLHVRSAAELNEVIIALAKRIEILERRGEGV